MIRLTMFFYLLWRVFLGIAGLFVILSGLIFLIDIIESLREVENIEGAGLDVALQLTLLRLPNIALSLMPFVFLFGSIFALAQLNRRSEIAVMRSSGLSVWQMILPPIMLALATGLGILTFIDPVASDLSTRSEMLKNDIRGKSSNLLQVMDDGIWLRQRDGDTALILYADAFDETQSVLDDVTFWRLTRTGGFVERWDASEVVVEDGRFVLKQARRRTSEDEDPEIRAEYIMPSVFDIADLRAEVAKPESMSVWDLPEFIALAEDVGLPTVKYELRYQDLLSLPLKLAAMVLIAAAFSLKPYRSGGTATLILAGVGAGFLLFIMSEVSKGTAEAMIVPVPLAAWGPVLIALMAAMTVLLTTEDG